MERPPGRGRRGIEGAKGVSWRPEEGEEGGELENVLLGMVG